MKRVHKIIFVVVCISLLITSMLAAFPVSASAATSVGTTNPYSDYNAPAGYYYFHGKISNFDALNDFTYSFVDNSAYFCRYELVDISKSGDFLTVHYKYPLSYNSGYEIRYDWIYDNSTESWNKDFYQYYEYPYPLFHISVDLNVPGSFGRILLYRSNEQYIYVNGTYTLKDEIVYDSSIWVYYGLGDFRVNGVVYDKLEINKSGYYTAKNSRNNSSLSLRYGDVNTGDYLIEFSNTLISMSVFNNFYNMFYRVSSSDYDSNSAYYNLSSNLSIPNFLTDYGSYTFSVSGSYPYENNVGSRSFNSLTFSYGINSGFGDIYVISADDVLLYSSLDGFYNEYYRYLKVDEDPSCVDALSYLSYVSVDDGGAAAFVYHERVGYALSTYNVKYSYNDAYNAGFSEGKNEGRNEGYSSGQKDGYSSGYSDGKTVGYSEGQTYGYHLGEKDGYSLGFEAGKADGNLNGRYYYWFPFLSDVALSDIVVEGFEGSIYILKSTATSMFESSVYEFTRIYYSVLGELIAVDELTNTSLVLYKEGNWVNDTYSYISISENDLELKEWADKYCTTSGSDGAILFYQELGEIQGYDYAFDDGYDSGYLDGAATSDGYDIGYSVGYDIGFDEGSVSGTPDFASWLDVAVGGFFSFEILPGLSLGGIMSVILGISLLLFFLKLFA